MAIVDSRIAAVLLPIVAELPLIAIVFCRTVVATEQPASMAAAAAIEIARVFMSLTPSSRHR